MENKNKLPLYTGMFKDRQSAENIYNALWKRGYDKDDVSLIMSEDTRKKHFSDAHTEMNRIAAGAGRGSVPGSIMGTITGIIAVAGTSLVLPGLGLIVAGPIAGGLAGAGAGEFTGGIIGALMGIPEQHAQKFESGVKAGRILISIRPRSQEDLSFVQQNWKENNVEEVYIK